MALRPMLARAGELPTSEDWAFEVKWDGFRAIVSTEDGLRVYSRRGWNMTDRLPELAELPADLVLDGEIVAFNGTGVPHFPDICARVLHGDGSIPVVYAVFDVLRVEGHDVTCTRGRSGGQCSRSSTYRRCAVSARTSSKTARRCSRRSSTAASRASSPSGGAASTGPAIAAG